MGVAAAEVADVAVGIMGTATERQLKRMSRQHEKTGTGWYSITSRIGPPTDGEKRVPSGENEAGAEAGRGIGGTGRGIGTVTDGETKDGEMMRIEIEGGMTETGRTTGTATGAETIETGIGKGISLGMAPHAVLHITRTTNAFVALYTVIFILATWLGLLLIPSRFSGLPHNNSLELVNLLTRLALAQGVHILHLHPLFLL